MQKARKPKAKKPASESKPKKPPRLTAAQAQAVGAELARRRNAAGLTTRELAARTGLHPSGIGAVEHARATPALGTLAVLARELGCRVADLVSGIDSAKK